ncbi:CsiV family protein [Legionella worsleiensis]|uniref:Peptidoglycan-binding protein CsiV n=1 Tax=Legionella worsleiensis TaxID=45076 RepID=A0A0W1AJ64_9GAMM|nr:CsiV family protein [Legionella worsleiensis]KTD81219.1 hypothetical protein Lwor_0897 [Legionella worsleiensis]STY33196.1 Protein of uncharacterised function (DUF2803) [Legionella worsleiensis]
MFRFLIILIAVFFSAITSAQSSYQVDIILFAHPTGSATRTELDLNAPLIPVSQKAIPLTKSRGRSNTAYTILPSSQSGLQNEYYLLSHKPGYKIIGHYSWRQPANNQSSIALPESNQNGWTVQGTIRIKQSNFYSLDTDLYLSPSDDPQSSLNIAQKQRIKGGMVYYLDNPLIGMLIKAHKVS